MIALDDIMRPHQEKELSLKHPILYTFPTLKRGNQKKKKKSTSALKCRTPQFETEYIMKTVKKEEKED